MCKKNVFKIISLKHDGQLHRSWETNELLANKDPILIGGNNRTIVKEADGEKWRTNMPAIFYFHKHYWFNVIVLFHTPHHYYYYCNISSPFVWNNREVHYIDYDIDVIVQSNFTYEVVDQNEFKENKRRYEYTPYIQKQVQQATNQLIDLIENKKPPFSPSFVKKWSAVYFKQN